MGYTVVYGAEKCIRFCVLLGRRRATIVASSKAHGSVPVSRSGSFPFALTCSLRPLSAVDSFLLSFDELVRENLRLFWEWVVMDAV